MENDIPAPNPIIQPPPLPSPTTAKSFLPIILGILLSISLAATAYFFLQNRSLRTQLTTTPFPTPSTPTTIAVDPTADWQTYENSLYRYSFRYPQEYNLFNMVDNELDSGVINDDDYKIYLAEKETGPIIMDLSIGYSLTDMVAPLSEFKPTKIDTNEFKYYYNANNNEEYYLVQLPKNITTQQDIELLISFVTENSVAKSVLETFSFQPLSSSGNSCTYQGQTYTDGQTFPDRCNSCSCRNGQIACTLMACLDWPIPLEILSTFKFTQ